jgi:diadenosine tetraphosphate (Ap4A) HIT family hydrolase
VSPEPASPFLAVPPDKWVAANDLAFAIRDIRPLFPGHTLVVTFRPVVDWWSATVAESLAIFDLVDVVRADLLDDLRRADMLPGVARPDGFNVGFNAGAHAGQTVMHLHVHVIPRYATADAGHPKDAIIEAVTGR